MMKLTSSWPRQPFVGISLAALLGVFLAEAAPHPSAGLIALVLWALVALWRKSSLATYAFVAGSFFSFTAFGKRILRVCASHGNSETHHKQ